MDFKQEILKAINTIIDEKIKQYKTDRTFMSIIKRKNADGTYTVLDESGGERNVKCSIPNLQLKTGQKVWVKIPLGDLRNVHICGIV